MYWCMTIEERWDLGVWLAPAGHSYGSCPNLNQVPQVQPQLGLFFFIPFIIFALLLLPSRNSDLRSHSGRFFPPPIYGTRIRYTRLALLSREDCGAFFPRRLASNSGRKSMSRNRTQVRSLAFFFVLFSVGFCFLLVIMYRAEH